MPNICWIEEDDTSRIPSGFTPSKFCAPHIAGSSDAHVCSGSSPAYFPCRTRIAPLLLRSTPLVLPTAPQLVFAAMRTFRTIYLAIIHNLQVYVSDD